MELPHLRYFAAVAEIQSFRLAAKRINVTQPAITPQIQDLEQMLGPRLLDRAPQGVKLTVAGEPFLREVRKSLGIPESATRAAHRGIPGFSGETAFPFGFGLGCAAFDSRKDISEVNNPRALAIQIAAFSHRYSRQQRSASFF